MIKINEKYAIDADSRCYMIKVYQGVDKHGEEIWISQHYFMSLEQALSRLRHFYIAQGFNLGNENFVLNKLEHINQQIEDKMGRLSTFNVYTAPKDDFE